mgnify:CR=1 FL=1
MSVCVVKSKAEGDRAARVTTLPQSGGEETFQRVAKIREMGRPGTHIASARARRRARDGADELELFRMTGSGAEMGLLRSRGSRDTRGTPRTRVV